MIKFERDLKVKIAIYARVSTTKDQSCERQILELQEIAKNHNWIVAGTYVAEGISGAKKNRPELDRMLKDALLS